VALVGAVEKSCLSLPRSVRVELGGGTEERRQMGATAAQGRGGEGRRHGAVERRRGEPLRRRGETGEGAVAVKESRNGARERQQCRGEAAKGGVVAAQEGATPEEGGAREEGGSRREAGGGGWEKINESFFV
jgi:hypothetical protein